MENDTLEIIFQIAVSIYPYISLHPYPYMFPISLWLGCFWILLSIWCVWFYTISGIHAGMKYVAMRTLAATSRPTSLQMTIVPKLTRAHKHVVLHQKKHTYPEIVWHELPTAVMSYSGASISTDEHVNIAARVPIMTYFSSLGAERVEAEALQTWNFQKWNPCWPNCRQGH